MDDDIKGWTNYRKALKGEKAASYFTETLDKLIAAFREFPVLRAITFPYKFEMFEEIPWRVTKRIQTAYIVRTSDMHADPRISVFEDFAAGLSIVARGGVIQRYGLMGIDCGVKVGGGTGGHQSFDRSAKAKDEVALLKEIYPPLQFRKVEKFWEIEPDLRSVKLAGE